MHTKPNLKKSIARSPLRSGLLLIALACFSLSPFLRSAGAAIPAGWGSFHGNFFVIGVPPGFVAKPRGNPGGGGKSDAVSLWNKASSVEFYVFSPQWNGRAEIMEVAQGAEVLTSKESNRTGSVLEVQLTITARDRSYVRFVISRTKENENTNTTWGIRVPNMKVYEQIRPTYVRWKQTLEQFAD